MEDTYSNADEFAEREYREDEVSSSSRAEMRLFGVVKTTIPGERIVYLNATYNNNDVWFAESLQEEDGSSWTDSDTSDDDDHDDDHDDDERVYDDGDVDLFGGELLHEHGVEEHTPSVEVF